MLLTIETERDAMEAMRAIESWICDSAACLWATNDDATFDRADALDAVHEAQRVMRAASRAPAPAPVPPS